MRTNFDYAFKNIILRWEGGYVNDPDDPGGETKFGISKRQYPDLDIKNLTTADAKKIYKRDYWDKCRCDKLPSGVDIMVFDFAVNAGIKRASAYLQLAINRVVGKKVIKVDGVIGPKTLRALKSVADYETLLNEYTSLRTRYYAYIGAKPRLRKFLYGWLRRTIYVHAEAVKCMNAA